ncbi:MAG: DNA-processing protein DprA [Thermohalobaculum sp.]
MTPVSANTKAILLLTAPLIFARGARAHELLSFGEYRMLARHLHELGSQPADLLGNDANEIVAALGPVADAGRVRRLLDRGLQLAQAVERWRQRAIWVVSRADPTYPRRLKARLKSHAPAVLYGCGEIAALDRGGLAVVGSRHIDEELVGYAAAAGALAGRANRQIVSGGAKGVDQAAMRGALDVGGMACGVLADSLERQVLARENRDMVACGQLVLVSPYDPSAGFNGGHAMQRNKVVYALADAALVVSSDVDKGGTWGGAIEQLKKLKLVPVYVRSTGAPQNGLDALRKNGAAPWPNPATPGDLQNVLAVRWHPPGEAQLPFEALQREPPAVPSSPNG